MNRLTILKYRIQGILSRPLPPCEEITERISLGLDQKLSVWDRLVIRLHLFTCDWCTLFKKQVKAIDRAMDEYSEVSPQVTDSDKHLSQEAREKIRKHLRDNQ